MRPEPARLLWKHCLPRSIQFTRYAGVAEPQAFGILFSIFLVYECFPVHLVVVPVLCTEDFVASTPPKSHCFCSCTVVP